MRPYKRYNSYKESGVPWIKAIPNYWESSRLKFHLSESSGGIWGQDDEFGNGTYVLRSTEITIDGHWNLQNLTTRKLGKEEAERFLLKKGDLIVTKSSGSQDHIGKTGFVDEKIEAMVVCYSNFVQKLRPRSHINSKFLHYFMNCPLAREQYKYQSETTTGLANLNTQSINELFISVPPKQEQAQIANFLDRKTDEIDRFIADKEKLIALLNEQKVATINRAVTKGINSDAKLKPTGVAWLGEIPEDWEIRRLKYELESLNKRRIPLSGPERGTMKNRRYDYYGASGIIDKVDDYIFDEPLLLIAEDGANLLLRNLPLAIIATGKYWVNNHAHILKPYRGNLYFFAYLLESMRYDQYISGSAQPKLTQDKLANIKISVPPVNEQWKIINVLNRETEKIDTAIARAQKEIYLIREYHQALISEAVTGKIDVRKTA